MLDVRPIDNSNRQSVADLDSGPLGQFHRRIQGKGPSRQRPGRVYRL